MKAIINKTTDIDTIDKNVTELHIWERKIDDTNFLKEFKNIRNLRLCCINAENLTFVETITTIEKLELMGITKIHDLSSIAKLKNLRELEITTIAGWDGSGKRIFYETLNPLINLKKLESLKMLDIEFYSDGLAPLIPIKSLKHFITRNNFTTFDFALIERYRPDIECKYAHVYRTWDGYEYYKCKKCGAYKIEFVGKDLSRRVYCLNCNKNKVDDLTKRYVDIQRTT